MSLGWRGSISTDARTCKTPTSLSSLAQVDTVGRPFRAHSPKPTSLLSHRQFATTGDAQGTDGPLYMGKDTHALSGPSQRTALEVLAANNVETIIQQNDGVTPTPVISRAILVYNRGRKEHLADGIVITPSHNPPEDGGFKYNPTNGGPADTDVTHWVETAQTSCCEPETLASSELPSTTRSGVVHT